MIGQRLFNLCMLIIQSYELIYVRDMRSCIAPSLLLFFRSFVLSLRSENMCSSKYVG